LSAQADFDTLLERYRAGEGWGPLARAISLVESTPPWDLRVPDPAEPVHIVGVTGPPGAGKSTLTARLIESFSGAGARAAVLAVDPSSPISGGAVLGDRVRMESAITGRPEVFVRSLASRGAHGAVASATRNAARLLEASGSFDVVVIETIGAGQTEVAVAGMADTVVLVTVPGLGDAVQAIKAGLMEVADLIVVNMVDRPGAQQTVRHLRLTFGRELVVKQTVATEGEGVEDLREELDRRWAAMRSGGALNAARERKRLVEATLVAEEWIRRTGGNGGAARPDDLKQAVKQILEEATSKWEA
jgi:LAO/AO transport system kinase